MVVVVVVVRDDGDGDESGHRMRTKGELHPTRASRCSIAIPKRALSASIRCVL